MKHIHLNGATPVGKLCVSAVKIRCDLASTNLKLLASFESLGRRCFTLKPSMALQSRNYIRPNEEHHKKGFLNLQGVQLYVKTLTVC